MQIEEEYLNEKQSGKLFPCIYEERDSDDDREWFQDENNNWCYVEKKEIKDEYSEDKNAKVEVYNVIRKRVKTFNNKCSVQSLSFENFMVLQFIRIYEENQPYVSDVETFIDKYSQKKKENPSLKIDDFLNSIEDERKQQKIDSENRMKGYKGCFLWIITIILLFVWYPLAIFTCPLTWKLFEIIKNKFSEKNNQ